VRALLRLARAPGAAAAAPLPPPPRGSKRVLASAAHRGFQISVLISLALLAGLLALDTSSAWLASVKLALGATMMAEGLLLASDWRGARGLTLWRLRRHRAHARGAPSSVLPRLAWKLASPALQLLGLIWLAAGLLTALVGSQGLG
jgi:hypothetical protein